MNTELPGRDDHSPTDTNNLGWMPMLVIGLGIAVVIMDATVVNVSLPSIINDLGISSIDAEWVQAIYALVFAALLIIFGRLGDRLGRRLIFTIGAIIFGVASIFAAMSDSGSALIAARALQGVGGAMMSPTSLSLVNALYTGRRRLIAFAIYGSIIGGMAAIGPLLGGWLTDAFSWRWAFGINIPIVIAIVVGTLLRVPESKSPPEEPGLDVVGALLSAVGIAALVFAFIEGRNYGWWRTSEDVSLLGLDFAEGALSPVAIALTVSAIALPLLLVLESKRAASGKAVLLDVSLFRIPTFGLGSTAALILSLGEFGILFSLPLFLQSALGYSPLQAGALLATLAVGAFVAAPTAARLAIARNPRFVARLGMALEVIGILGIALVVSPTVSAAWLVLWLVIYGMGVGYASAQLTGLILADVPVAKSGQASGTQSTARQIGSAMGTAVLGTVLFLSLSHDTENRLVDVGVPQSQASEIASAVETSAGTIIPTLSAAPGSPEIQAAAEQAFADSVRRTALVAAGFVTLGLIATLALPLSGRRDDEESDAGAPSAPTVST